MVGDEQIGSVGSPETQVLFSFEKLLSNLNPHKAAGPDQIKPIILTNRSTPLSPILKHLFQKSLDSGT